MAEWTIHIESQPYPDSIATSEALDRFADELDAREIDEPAASIHDSAFGATFNLKAPTQADAKAKATQLFVEALQVTLEHAPAPEIAEVTVVPESDDV